MELFDVYQVAPTPYGSKELSRYTEDELRRIADLKEDRLNQCEAVLTFPFDLTMTTPSPAKGAVTPAGTVEKYKVPDTAYDSVTGLYTAIYDGTYDLKCNIYIVDPGATPANFYHASLGYRLNGGIPAWEYFAAEHETLPMVLPFSAGITGIVAGDTIEPIYSCYSATLSGTFQAYSYIHIKRLR